MRKYTVEFIGTFFLLSGAILGGAIGASVALMVMVYAGGHISGAHFNPAVSTAVFIRGKLTPQDVPGYLIAQFLGAAVAALLLYYVFGTRGNIPDCSGFKHGVVKTFLAELIGTFCLAYVVLHVATARGTAGNSFYGLAIGGTLLAMALAFGSFSGGVFNPAVGFGLALQKSLCWSTLWLYFVAPLSGGALAGWVFLFVNGADEEIPESIPDDRVRT